MTFTMTSGISAIKPRPICSAFSEIPGPELAVIALAPLALAPRATEIPAISSSICINVPPCFGKSTLSSWAISLLGVIGYPPKKLQPHSTAALATRAFPVDTTSLMRSLQVLQIYLPLRLQLALCSQALALQI